MPITMSSFANKQQLDDSAEGSFMWSKNRRGPRREPCGALDTSGAFCEILPSGSNC